MSNTVCNNPKCPCIFAIQTYSKYCGTKQMPYSQICVVNLVKSMTK